MKIEWEGRVYDYDPLGALMSQAEQMTRFTGCATMSEWEKLTVAADDPRFPKALTAGLWLMLRQDGQTIQLSEMDPPYMKFFQALAAAVQTEAGAAAEAEEDPTTPAAGSGGTSPPLPDVSAG